MPVPHHRGSGPWLNARTGEGREGFPRAEADAQRWPELASLHQAPPSADAALGIWVLVSLVGVVLGFAAAKHAQLWAGATFHPAVVPGAFVVVASIGAAGLAAVRFVERALSVRGAGLRFTDTALVTVAACMVLWLAWAALAIIFFAGWELPAPSRGG